MWNEFKKFALRGNMVDLAVGIILGAAFGRIISSLVDDILMPPIGMLVGGVDFTDLRVVLRGGANPVTINYGTFLQVTFDFLIVAAAMFFMIRAMNRLQAKEEAKPVPTEAPREQKLLEEIRDLLKTRRAA